MADVPEKAAVASYDDVADEGSADLSSTASSDQLPPLPPTRQYSIFGNRKIKFNSPKRGLLGSLKGLPPLPSQYPLTQILLLHPSTTRESST